MCVWVGRRERSQRTGADGNTEQIWERRMRKRSGSEWEKNLEKERGGNERKTTREIRSQVAPDLPPSLIRLKMSDWRLNVINVIKRRKKKKRRNNNFDSVLRFALEFLCPPPPGNGAEDVVAVSIRMCRVMYRYAVCVYDGLQTYTGVTDVG